MILCYLYSSRLGYTFIRTRGIISYKLINFLVC
uniref:Uncharacterized protein n=1 Tax=Myoviridae sp. ct0jJ30 TaxID=2825014 RepID=A0A8S5PH49_9CAUD|nr:MAG TPA: hypothetical protein [Myoviridae sp. ct0jJ30]